MSHMLDRPIWGALVGGHVHLATGSELARRYPADISPFIASKDAAPASLDAVAALVGPGQQVVMVEAGSVAVPTGLTVLSTASALQMTNEVPFEPIEDDRIAPLSIADAQDMLDLALLTKPGPFTLRALELGPFWGIHIDGRLAAMAGTRLVMPGWTELSGVCAHPDFRGRGLAKSLSHFVGRQISARGDKVFLHSYAKNPGAIGLYQSLGFAVRAEMQVVVAQK